MIKRDERLMIIGSYARIVRGRFETDSLIRFRKRLAIVVAQFMHAPDWAFPESFLDR